MDFYILLCGSSARVCAPRSRPELRWVRFIGRKELARQDVGASPTCPEQNPWPEGRVLQRRRGYSLAGLDDSDPRMPVEFPEPIPLPARFLSDDLDDKAPEFRPVAVVA